jgi:integrase
MASLRKQSKGNSWQLRVTLKGERITLSLRNMESAKAEEWKVFVQSIADSIELKRPFDRLQLDWLASLNREQRQKLSDKGLIDPDEPEEVEVEKVLSDYLTEYFESRKSDVKPATWIFYQHTRKRLNEYFAGRTLRSITPSDAKAFRKWLEEQSNKRDKKQERSGISINTVRRRTGLCRQVFSQALEDGLVDRNPFLGLSTTVRSNKERKHYVDLDTFAKILEKAPNARWKALLVLSRLGAVRVPSEIAKLKWEHVNFEAKRIFIVDSSKTERHKRRAIRAIPLLPQIETELLKLHLEAQDGEEYVFPNISGQTNLRTYLERIIRNAGVKQWPKLWHNLRASGATDFARTLPSHVAAEICGHTEEIAKEHYWQVGESDLNLAIEKLGRSELAQMLAHEGDLSGPESSLDGSEALGPETKKPQVSLGFDMICQLLSEAGFCLAMGEEGLEPPTSTL